MGHSSVAANAPESIRSGLVRDLRAKRRVDIATAPITDTPSPPLSPRKERERTQPYAAEWYSLREFRVNGLI